MPSTGNSENEFIPRESLLILKIALSYEKKLSYGIFLCLFMYRLFYARKLQKAEIKVSAFCLTSMMFVLCLIEVIISFPALRVLPLPHN